MPLGIFKGLREKFQRLFQRGTVDESLFLELEETLISADMSVSLVDELLTALREKTSKEHITDSERLRSELKRLLTEKLASEEGSLRVHSTPPTVYLFLGVNGSGKTTTIAKLAHFLKKQNKKVIVAAADTFRAAAIEQLEIWARRATADIVKGNPGGDPGAVVFDAIQAAKARGADYVLADTAGRQHTRTHLMSELEKIVRVAEKALGRQPDEVLLVLDGHTGQNAIRQAEEFRKVAGLTGVVITKLDGTSKGGAVLSIKDRLGIPIKLIGYGEKLEDLKPFHAEEFAEELLS
ncbi:MAG TPA: signal recognition particle-docking protein FtsY [Fimbriimonadales bacterium]|nr:signal recognition particle-docking protein FtsY [Fimbriimonadales bacterium]